MIAQTDARNLARLRLLERLKGRPLARIAVEFRGKPCVELSDLLAERGPVISARALASLPAVSICKGLPATPAAHSPQGSPCCLIPSRSAR